MKKCQRKLCTKPELCRCRIVRHTIIPIVWIIGGTGSGKNAQSKRISGKYDFDIINAAAIFRGEISGGATRGDDFEELIQNGQLIPDEDVIEVFERSMSKLAQHSKGFAVTSFPKTIKQAQLFEQYVAPVDLIIHLDCKEETMIQRTIQRRAVAGELAYREDNEVTARIRIDKFNAVLPKIYEKYESITKKIDSEQHEQKVFDDICPLIDKIIEDKNEKSKEVQESKQAKETADLQQ